mmetsp:Transcript_29849/g.55815  ORF Transcript_29849/g.55815 Transcript_29849/m.55815 type:complete len:165 (-) Transcript_29849:27-521(-)
MSYMNSKQSILNRKGVRPSKANLSSADREWEKEQQKLAALKNRREQMTNWRARQLYGTRTEREELKEERRADMLRAKIIKQTNIQREMELDKKANADIEAHNLKMERLHKQREEARRSYLTHIAQENRKLEQYRRRKQEVSALKEQVDSQKSPDFFARFGRNAL